MVLLPQTRVGAGGSFFLRATESHHLQKSNRIPLLFGYVEGPVIKHPLIPRLSRGRLLLYLLRVIHMFLQVSSVARNHESVFDPMDNHLALLMFEQSLLVDEIHAIINRDRKSVV